MGDHDFISPLACTRLRIMLRVLFVVVGMTVATFAVADDAAVEFNRDVRSILSDNCFLCHGSNESDRRAGLRLDVREEAIDAFAIVPGDPEASELWARITSDDPDMVMPPPSTKKELTPDEVEVLGRWITQGASYDEHWAFLPPERPEVPEVSDPDWVQNPIDRFVMARLDRQSMAPSPPADQVSLVRRLYLDLVGLPPTPEQVDAYLADPDTERLIERLLRSPHFGERWARWWLDAARYADSDGYEKDKPRSVWFYRDWVIDALNQDMPYDEFVIQQIAGDLLPGAGQAERVATGFLRNSMTNEEGGADPEQFRVEGMFDRVDAIGKAILGITTQCAQCHTHKYDPLSHREYYQMYAALNDFHEGTISVFTPDQDERRREVTAQIAEIEQGLKQQQPDWAEQVAQWADQEAERRVRWQTIVPTDRPYEGQKFRVLDDRSILSESYAPTKSNITMSLSMTAEKITAVRIDALTHPQLPRGGPGRSIFGTGALSEFEVEITPLDQPDKKRKVKIARAVSDVNPPRSELPAVFRDREPDQDDRVTGPVEYAIDGDNKTAWTTATDPGRRNEDRHAIFVFEEPITEPGEFRLSLTLRQLHGGWNSDDNQNYLLGRYRFSISDAEEIPDTTLPTRFERALAVDPEQRTEDDLAVLFRHWRTTVPEFASENERIESLWQRFPETDTQLVAIAKDQPRTSHVFERGDFLSPGEEVTAGVPEFLHRWSESDEPARLRLARWLASSDSPTTARVIVNRIWQSYFGRGLVTTPEDFGFQSASPSHPQLLDWLATELIDSGWRLKHVHRLITTSATYQQSSRMTDESLQADQFNRWLARGPRFRLDAELVRDAALHAGGLLDLRIGGPSVYPPAPDFLFQPPASYGPKVWATSSGGDAYRRSLYVHRFRSVPYPVTQAFDAPKGDAACVRREQSNTPLQALVMLNETQFVESARALAARILREAGPTDQERLRYAHRVCTSRDPSSHEQEVLQRLLEQQRARIAADEVDVAGLVGTERASVRQLTGHAAEELAPWVVVARALLNLDETITKP